MSILQIAIFGFLSVCAVILIAHFTKSTQKDWDEEYRPCAGECNEGRLPRPAHCPRNQQPKEKTP